MTSVKEKREPFNLLMRSCLTICWIESETTKCEWLLLLLWVMALLLGSRCPSLFLLIASQSSLWWSEVCLLVCLFVRYINKICIEWRRRVFCSKFVKLIWTGGAVYGCAALCICSHSDYSTLILAVKRTGSSSFDDAKFPSSKLWKLFIIIRATRFNVGYL